MLRVRVLVVAWTVGLAISAPALAQSSQGIIEETDRRMHELFDDSGCLRVEGCGDTTAAVPHYGAMVLSPDGRHYGVGWDFQYSGDALATAMERCGADCRVAVETANACLAVVKSVRPEGANTYFALDDSPERAEITATDLCIRSGDRGCFVDLAVCGGNPWGAYTYERDTEWVGAHAMVGEWIVTWEDDATAERPLTLNWPGAEHRFQGTVVDMQGDTCMLTGFVQDSAPTLAFDIECPTWKGGMSGEAALDGSAAEGFYVNPNVASGDFWMRRHN